MTEPYLTIAKNTTYEQTIKKSRFICSIARVSSEEEAQQFITSIQAANKKATHNCFAYMIGDNDRIQRESDNGEPSGTAGIPILESLKLAKIHNVVAVVTRYFGGILLGGGGLVRAYSHSAKIAVDSAKIITMALCLDLKIECDYNFYGKLGAFLSSENTVILDTVFTDSVTVIFRIKKDFYEAFSAKLTDLSNGKTEAEIISEKFCEF